jgi:hypothetical protein
MRSKLFTIYFDTQISYSDISSAHWAHGSTSQKMVSPAIGMENVFASCKEEQLVLIVWSCANGTVFLISITMSIWGEHEFKPII